MIINRFIYLIARFFDLYLQPLLLCLFMNIFAESIDSDHDTVSDIFSDIMTFGKKMITRDDIKDFKLNCCKSAVYVYKLLQVILLMLHKKYEKLIQVQKQILGRQQQLLFLEALWQSLHHS